MSLTSIIMVSYQTGPVLFEAIRAALSQSQPVELCLVDNGNPLEVVERLRDMALSNPRLQLITGQGNVGFAKACNLGARAAKGEYLLFLNPDSKLLPDTIEKLYAHVISLENNSNKNNHPPLVGGSKFTERSGVNFGEGSSFKDLPLPEKSLTGVQDFSTLPQGEGEGIALGHSSKKPFMIGARLLSEDGDDQRGCRRALLTPATAFIEALHLGFLFPKARLNFNDEPVAESLTNIPAISGAFMFLPCDDFWHIEGFDEGYFLHVEDLDLCLAFRRAGGEIYFAPDIPVTHIGATSKATPAFIEMHKARGFRRYFTKNFGYYPRILLLLLDLAIYARAALKIALSRVKSKVS